MYLLKLCKSGKPFHFILLNLIVMLPFFLVLYPHYDSLILPNCIRFLLTNSYFPTNSPNFVNCVPIFLLRTNARVTSRHLSVSLRELIPHTTFVTNVFKSAISCLIHACTLSNNFILASKAWHTSSISWGWSTAPDSYNLRTHIIFVGATGFSRITDSFFLLKLLLSKLLVLMQHSYAPSESAW